MSRLRAMLDHDSLLRRAGARSFDRGRRYAAEGRVHVVDEEGDAVSGEVEGTREYEVRIWAEGDDLAAACDCPMGMDGAFCKHGVALWRGSEPSALTVR